MGQYMYIDQITVLSSYIQEVWVFVFGVLVAHVLVGTCCKVTWLRLQECCLCVKFFYSSVECGFEGARGERKVSLHVPQRCGLSCDKGA